MQQAAAHLVKIDLTRTLARRAAHHTRSTSTHGGMGMKVPFNPATDHLILSW